MRCGELLAKNAFLSNMSAGRVDFCSDSIFNNRGVVDIVKSWKRLKKEGIFNQSNRILYYIEKHNSVVVHHASLRLLTIDIKGSSSVIEEIATQKQGVGPSKTT